MKYLLLSVALVFGSYCWGQKKDSVVIDFNNTYSAGLMGGVVYSPKQDTVKVLMLVCDTGWIECTGCASAMNTKTGERTPPSTFKSQHTWGQCGYVVYELEYGQIPCETMGTGLVAIVCHGWYRNKFIEYLDQNKKPLPSSIVVWQAKEIKN